MCAQRLLVAVYIMALCGLNACSPGNVKQRQAPDLHNTQRIDLRIISNDPQAVLMGINQEVIKNLADWEYPVGPQKGMPYSHMLTATVGEVQRGNTPTGFSFSAGNPDPRALDYQKLDILPISCTLTTIANPEQISELSMGFTANAKNRSALDKAKLADHISTVCFNVLLEVKWPLTKSVMKTTKTQANWIPEVQIETKETPLATEKNAEKAIPNGNPVASDPRKEVIIHNQGSPVILNFGHQRR
jgi:hypothetical protein